MNQLFLNLSRNEWIIIIVSLAILIILLILFFLLFPIIKRRHNFKNFREIYYKKIRKVADLKDYYLINNLTLRNNDQIICRIDHILFGDKFIYVIKDRYYRGAIVGDKSDLTWLFFNKHGEKSEMDNPMLMNKKRIEKLSLMTQIDSSFFVSIVIINDDCVVKNMNNLNEENSFIVASSKINKLIKVIENRDIKKMDENQLKYAVMDISKLYGEGGDEYETNENEEE